MKNIKKMLCVLFAIVTVMTSIFTVNTQAKAIKGTQIISVSIPVTGIKIKWNTVKGVTGYQLQTAKSKDFKKNKKTFTIAKANASSKLLKNKDLKAFKPYKKYYVRIRSYKKSGKKTAYSKWSSVKNFKTPNLITYHDYTYVVCTTNNNHQAECGNISGWYKSREEFYKAYSVETDYWTDLLDKEIISWDEYVLKVPCGYECWSCGFCGKWTGNFKYSGEDDVAYVRPPYPHIY